MKSSNDSFRFCDIEQRISDIHSLRDPKITRVISASTAQAISPSSIDGFVLSGTVERFVRDVEFVTEQLVNPLGKSNDITFDFV